MSTRYTVTAAVAKLHARIEAIPAQPGQDRIIAAVLVDAHRLIAQLPPPLPTQPPQTAPER